MYRVRYWTKWVCTFWGAAVGFMASVILTGVGKKLFGVLVLLWLWRFAKEDEHFWLGQFDSQHFPKLGRGGLIDSTFGRGGSGNYVDFN